MATLSDTKERCLCHLHASTIFKSASQIKTILRGQNTVKWTLSIFPSILFELTWRIPLVHSLVPVTIATKVMAAQTATLIETHYNRVAGVPSGSQGCSSLYLRPAGWTRIKSSTYNTWTCRRLQQEVYSMSITFRKRGAELHPEQV